MRLLLLIIGWLYECEAKWDEHNLTPSDRRRHRQKLYPRPLYWLKKVATGVRERMPPKLGLAKACDYLLRYRTPLKAHLEHGETRLDNNLVENAIRPSAIGKKNWLFIGHPDAGQRSAIIYSIVVSCQRRGLDPQAYLRDVLTRPPRMAALAQTRRNRRPSRGLLYHSDQGVQYACQEYRNALAAAGMVCSMSCRGNCYDVSVQLGRGDGRAGVG